MNVSVLRQLFLCITLLAAVGTARAQCVTAVDGGQIGPATQTICAGELPGLLQGLQPASAATTNGFEYLWMQSTNANALGVGTYNVIPGATGADYQPGALTRTTVFIRCARIAGCSTDYPYETNVAVVNVNPLPLADIQTAPNQANVNQLVTFGAAPQANVTYSYTFEDGSPATANDRNATTQFTSGGVKTVTLTVTNTLTGCTSTDSRQILINGVLPVVWNYYRATLADGDVHLDWSTALESNTDRYEIECSTDGKAFRYLGEVSAAGNSQSEIRYHFVHAAPAAGTHYYRLRQLDLDGRYELTDVMPIRVLDAVDGFSAGPNPANESIYLHLPTTAAYELQVVELGSGRTVRRLAIPADTPGYRLALDTLTEGQYALRLVGEGRVQTQVITKIK